MKTRLILFAVLVLTMATAAMAADDAHIGTWKLNVAKSKFNGPPPKSETVVFTSVDKGIKLVDETEEASGKKSKDELLFIFDGKDYPFPNNPDADTFAVKRTAPNTWSEVYKMGGKKVGEGSNTISKDGKTMIHVSSGTNAKGERTSETTVFDKQ